MSTAIRIWLHTALLVGAMARPEGLAAQDTAGVRISGDSVTVRFVDADLRGVVQSLGRFLAKPVLTANLPAARVSLETPAPVSRPEVVTLLRGVVESQGLEMIEDSAFFRVGPKSPDRLAADPPPATAEARAQDANQPPVQLFVVRLKHARAADVAATVNLLFGASGDFSGRAGLSSGTLSDDLRRNNVPPRENPDGLRQLPPSDTSALRPAALANAAVIVPDEITNSLLVRATKEDFDVLASAVDQLDIRPLQVLIEILIVEARHDRNFSLGADLFLPKTGIGGDATIDGSLVGGGLGDLVIRIMRLGRINLDAIFRTAQSKGDVEIISRPVLLASNNTEARLLVGSQRPFIQVSRSLPTDAAIRDQVVQYRDVGTKLLVRPTINQDGYVSLVLQQEVNAATNETQFDAPIISTREASTQVLVRDGQTIVLGGLRDRQKDRSQSGVPLLSGLPIIGGVFGSSRRGSSSTELYLFLTPRIIRSDEDVEKVTMPRLPAGVAP